MRQCKFCDNYTQDSEYARHIRTHKKEENAVCLSCGAILGKDSFYSHAIYLCKVDIGRMSSGALSILKNKMLSQKNKRKAKVFQGGLPSLGKRKP